jgi:hypothetical protein
VSWAYFLRPCFVVGYEACGTAGYCIARPAKWVMPVCVLWKRGVHCSSAFYSRHVKHSQQIVVFWPTVMVDDQNLSVMLFHIDEHSVDVVSV